MKNEMFNYDYSALRGKIKEKYSNEKKFISVLKQKGLKICPAAFSNKITRKVDFKQTEILVICMLLDIPLENMATYFFKQKYELNS